MQIVGMPHCRGSLFALRNSSLPPLSEVMIYEVLLKFLSLL